MLPRSKSIFYIGEEGGEEETAPAKKSGNTRAEKLKSIRGAADNDIQGLRILIQQQHHEQVGIGSNIILVKSTLMMRRPSSRVLTMSGFLETCLLCKRQLSLQKEVYMYRGDQGFCSPECRCRQILLEERRELEAITARMRLGTVPRRVKARQSDRRRRISAAV